MSAFLLVVGAPISRGSLRAPAGSRKMQRDRDTTRACDVVDDATAVTDSAPSDLFTDAAGQEVKVLKQTFQVMSFKDCVNLNAHTHTVNSALSAQLRSLTHLRISEALLARRSPALPARRERARGGPTSTRTAFSRTPFPPNIHKFDEFLFLFAHA